MHQPTFISHMSHMHLGSNILRLEDMPSLVMPADDDAVRQADYWRDDLVGSSSDEESRGQNGSHGAAAGRELA